jgi:hypothetical protein
MRRSKYYTRGYCTTFKTHAVTSTDELGTSHRAPRDARSKGFELEAHSGLLAGSSPSPLCGGPNLLRASACRCKGTAAPGGGGPCWGRATLAAMRHLNQELRPPGTASCSASHAATRTLKAH